MKTNKSGKEGFLSSVVFLEAVDDDDEANRNDENVDDTDETSDLRISQPRYSQLLKELDFSHARMVN